MNNDIRQKIHVAHCDSDASKYIYVGSCMLTCLEIALSDRAYAQFWVCTINKLRTKLSLTQKWVIAYMCVKMR